jgi:hypothetical protein
MIFILFVYYKFTMKTGVLEVLTAEMLGNRSLWSVLLRITLLTVLLISNEKFFSAKWQGCRPANRKNISLMKPVCSKKARVRAELQGFCKKNTTSCHYKKVL